jgi:hypothetical protein
MAEAAMQIDDDLRIRGSIELEQKHWELWGEAESRGGGLQLGRLGYGSVWPSKPDPDHESARSRYACTPRDDDIAEAIGHGVTWLMHRGELMARRAIALRARFVSASDTVSLQKLAKKWGITPARATQYWQEGQGLVEQWVLENYSDE